jgi:Zn-dependent peptidase ImmA (M78 family)
MHSEIQFKQQKIMILSRFTSDSNQKTQKIERLANAFPPLIQMFLFTNNKFMYKLGEIYYTKRLGKNIESLTF